MNESDWDILALRGVTPENLTVGKALYLDGTQITELPENLTVGKALYLDGTQITELPENLTVGEALYMGDTQIASAGKLNGKQVNTAEQSEPYLREIARHALDGCALDMHVVHSRCGTSHCIAGWAGVLFPEHVREGHELIDSVNLLGVDAAKMFFKNNDDGREFLEQFVD